MGQACCNYKPKDPNDLNFDQSKKPQKLDPALNDLLNHAQQNEEKIVKIQAGFRGFKARKEQMNDEGGSRPSQRKEKG